MNVQQLARRAFTSVEVLVKAASYVGIAALLVMMLLTVADVLLRYVFNSPIFGGMEITESLLVTLSFISIAYCSVVDGQVKMEILVGHLPGRAQRAVEAFGYLLLLALMGPMTGLFIPEALYMQRVGEESGLLGIPAYPFYWVAAVCCLLVTLVLLRNLVGALFRLVKP